MKKNRRSREQYGKYVHRYKRNRRTLWYFIYDKIGENVFINKIISNYVTIN